MNIEILKPVIERGYSEICADIKELVIRRIEIKGAVILTNYVSEDRNYVEGYCTKHNIDLINVLTGNEEYKEEVGLKLIENEIMTLLASKSKYDDEIKQLKISPIRITNGIENAPWLALFDSPNNLQWFVKRSNQVIESLPNNKWYEYICKTIETIKANWVDPQSVIPNLGDYQQLMDLKVPDEVKDLVVKPSGN
jgi:hypothetical protein